MSTEEEKGALEKLIDAAENAATLAGVRIRGENTTAVSMEGACRLLELATTSLQFVASQAGVNGPGPRKIYKRLYGVEP